MSEQQGPPPEAVMIEMLNGFFVAKAIGTAAKFGVADQLNDGPKTVEELAKATNTHAPSLYRLLRALASYGIFTEVSPKKFALTPLAATLRTGVPGSMRSMAAMWTDKWHDLAWAEFPHSVRTGGTAMEKAFGEGVFPYLAKNPESQAIFDGAMTGLATQTAAGVTAAYDFAGIGTLCDIGGGHGKLISSILKANPKLKGILFDQPHVVAAAREPAAAGVTNRCRAVGGDFFKEVPAADAHIMSAIIHDWDDEKAAAILRNCRRAVSTDGKLLVVDCVIPPGDAKHFGKTLDLEMLALPGGKERTEEEFAILFKSAGYKLSRIVHTRGPLSVVEGWPA